MKNKCIPACVTAFMLFTTAGAMGAENQTHLAGGYAIAPAVDKNVVEAATCAVQEQRKILRKTAGGLPAELKFVKILGAEQQVVAGINYRLRLKVQLNGDDKVAEAVVWRQAWRKPKPCQLTSWIWK